MTDPERILSIDRPEEIDWDIEVDILVVGAGGCGLVTALAAAERGASVLIVEKEKDAGGNTSLSQAMVPATGTRLQHTAGIEDSVQLMTADILKKNKNGSDPELTAHIAAQSAPLIDWLKDNMNIEFELVSDFLYPGHSAHRIHANSSRKGKNLVNDLLNAVSRFENIDIAYNAPAVRLVALKSDSAVLGAEIEIEGIGTNLARAKKVILALNGFGANRDMLKKYIPEMSVAYYFGHEGNTGEGILWGKDLGAQLQYMGAYQSHGSVAHPHGTLLTWAIISLGGYQVNLLGERFVNEFHGYSEHALDVWPRKRVWQWRFSISVSIGRCRTTKISSNVTGWAQLKNLTALKPWRGDLICRSTLWRRPIVNISWLPPVMRPTRTVAKNLNGPWSRRYTV